MTLEIPVFGVIKWSNYQHKTLQYSLGTKYFIYSGLSIENEYNYFYEITNEMRGEYENNYFQITISEYPKLKQERFNTAFIDLNDTALKRTRREILENRNNITLICQIAREEAIKAFQTLQKSKNTPNIIKKDITESFQRGHSLFI